MKFDLAHALALPKLPTYLGRVQTALEEVTHTTNPYIQVPVTRIVTAPSKRLRSALVIAAAGGKVTDTVIAAAAAIELVHLGSLVHDDIMDNASTRWGRETINKKEGVNQAIIVGDFLFAKANQVASTIHPECAHLVAMAIVNLCDGQAREAASLYDTTRTVDAYMTAITGKTASLLAAACRAGALAGESGPAKANALHGFGEAFGISFQLIDDVLDLISSPSLLGKPTASDIREGVYTLPVLLGLNGPQGDQLSLYLEKAKQYPLDSEIYPLIARPIKQSLQKIKQYNQRAKQQLEGMDDQLASLPESYTTWALSQLVASEHQEIVGNTQDLSTRS